MRKTLSNPHAEAAPLCARQKKRSRSTCGSVPKNPRRFHPKTGAAFCCRTARKSPPPPGKFSPKTKKRATLGALFNDYCKNHILVGVPKHTPPGFFNPLRCFSLRRACPHAATAGGLPHPASPAAQSAALRLAAPPGKNPPPRRGSFAAAFPENKKAGCPRCTPNDCCKNHILVGVPKRTPLFPPDFFNPLRCFSLRQACPTQKPPRCEPAEKKRSRSTCGGVPKNPRRFRPKTGAAFRSVPRTPPPGFFYPLRCFSLRQACPTQPRREDFRTPQAPPPNRRLCGLPHRRGSFAAVLPETKKRATFGALFSDYCKDHILVGVPKRTPHPPAGLF